LSISRAPSSRRWWLPCLHFLAIFLTVPLAVTAEANPCDTVCGIDVSCSTPCMSGDSATTCEFAGQCRHFPPDCFDNATTTYNTKVNICESKRMECPINSDEDKINCAQDASNCLGAAKGDYDVDFADCERRCPLGNFECP
jgi:hypothetical protein